MTELKLDIGLSKDHFVSKYVNYASSLTDAYPEWHFAGAFSLLSIVANRKLVFKLPQTNIYPNLWFFGLGDSTTSRKSTSMRIADAVLNSVNPVGVDKVPDSFSPESFIEHMADEPCSYFWKDEASELLASLSKDYMHDIRDILCDLYECEDYKRKLRTSRSTGVPVVMDIKNPYLTQWLMTTPENFREHTRKLDTTSGWLVRYLFLYPHYRKQWLGFRQMTPDDIKHHTDVVGSLNNINSTVSGMLTGSNTSEIEITMQDDAWIFFNEWQKQVETDALNSMDKIALSILGRLEIYAVKLAMLIELGSPNFNPEITKPTLETSCRWITDYFLPVARRISLEVEWNESKNMQEKILGILKDNNGEMTLRSLMKRMHMRKSDILAELDSLVASGEITIKKSSKNKTSHMITLT